MADSSVPPGFGDLLGLLGGANPLAGISKSIAQFQRGVGDFLHAVENFNQTMEQLNTITARVNRLLDDVEPPVRALLPQLTRTLKSADQLVEQLSAPLDRVVPGLTRLAETLQSPQFNQLPSQLGDFMSTLSEVAKRLQPLTQLAESAGGLFGLRALSSLRGGGTATKPVIPPPSTAVAPSPAKKAPAKKAPAKKAPAKKAPAKKAPAKKK